MTMATLDDFEIWSKHLYQFTRGVPHDDYMSDTACLSAEDINSKGAGWLNDKSLLRKRLPSEWLIPEYGRLEGGKIVEYAEADLDVGTAIFETDVVLKDVGASSGKNIWFLSAGMEEREREHILNQAVTRSHISKIQVCDWAKQHSYAEKIWPNGSNTLRFLVFSPEGEYPQIAAAVQKWATLHSGRCDNWNQGGLTTTVINGVMGDTMEDFTDRSQRGGNGSGRNPTRPLRPTRYVSHPEHGSEIMGVKIPFWQEAERMVLEASNILREELPYIGWDVIITEDGPKIIEGNPWPGIQLMQVHFPLLANVRFRDFLESHQVKGL